MASEQTPEMKAAEARGERNAFIIFGVIITALLGGFLTLGVLGVGLVALATVPVIYLLLVLMAGGKG